MSLTVEANYDGKVFQPDASLDLPAHRRYTLTIEPVAEGNGERRPTSEETYPLTAIAALAVDMGVTDLAERHHEYAHRVLKEE